MRRAILIVLATLVPATVTAQDLPDGAQAPDEQAAPVEEGDAPVETPDAAETVPVEAPARIDEPVPQALPANTNDGAGEGGAAKPPPSDESPIPEQSLDQFLSMAMQNAAVLDEHAAKIRKAEWQQYRAKWAWGPKLRNDTTVAPVPANADPDDFGANVDEFFSLDIGPYIRQSTTIIVPVYTFGRINVARELAGLGVDSAELQRERATRDLEYQVKRAYYSAQLSNSFQTLLGEGTGIIKEKLAEMDEARDFGEADFDTADFRKLQVFDAELDSRVLDNQKLNDIATAGLKYFTDYRGLVNAGEIDTDAEPVPLQELPAYIDLAKTHRSELRLLDHAVEARELQLKLERRNYYPNVFVAANLGTGWSTEELALQRICREPSPGAQCVDTDDLYSRPFSDPLNFFSFGIALGVRWEFDFWQRHGKLNEVKAQNDEVLAQRRRALGAIVLEIKKLHTDARVALEKVAVTERRLEAARRWRDQFGLTMQTGGGDIKDAVDPLKAYFEARALHLQARYDYLVARAALAQGVGLPTLQSELNESASTSSDD